MVLPSSLTNLTILLYLLQILIKVIKHYRCPRSPLCAFPLPILCRDNDYSEFEVYHSDLCFTNYAFIQRLCLAFSCFKHYVDGTRLCAIVYKVRPIFTNGKISHKIGFIGFS